MTVAALRQLLAEVDTQGGPAAARADRLHLDEPVKDAAAVRAWARQAGIDCPTFGRIPYRVLDAWHTATHPPIRSSS